MSLEIHCQTRGSLRPDPEHDEVSCIFYNIQNNVPSDNTDPTNIIGIIINTSSGVNQDKDFTAPLYLGTIVDEKTIVECVSCERELLFRLIAVVAKWDPDIFAGYEIEMSSWGYVLQRGQKLDMNLVSFFSRVPSQKSRPIVDDDVPGEWWGHVEFEVKLCGRIFLDVWRLMRSEIALTSYTFENVMYHIIHRRYPVHDLKDLTRLWIGAVTKCIVLEYYLERVKGTLTLLNQLDLIGRTCEMAKLFGIQFYEVLSRGSQFRVESMMLR